MEPEAPSAALREFLKSGETACPRCGYALAGLNATRCPECGEALRLALALERPRVSVAASLVLCWGVVTGLVLVLGDLWVGWTVWGSGAAKPDFWGFLRAIYFSGDPAASINALWGLAMVILSGGWQVALIRRRRRGIGRRMRRATTVVCAIVLFNLPGMFLLASLF